MTRMIAEIVLRAPDGASVLDAAAGLAPEDVSRYAPDPETVARARRLLEARGFTIEATGPVGLTVSCAPEVFERTFGTRPEPRPDVAARAGYDTGGPPYATARPPAVPPDLREVVAGVALPQPPELFP